MKNLLSIIVLYCILFFISCGGEEHHGIELTEEPNSNNGIAITDNQNNKGDSLTNKKDSIQPSTDQKPDSLNEYSTNGGKKYLYVEKYSSGIIKHQSAACYGDYAFFLLDGMKKVQMYNLKKKQEISILSQKSLGQASVYHCNQSCFGKEKFAPEDPFPLLYVSMFQASGRCSAMVYRILANWNNDIKEYDSFRTELVQTIYYPKASDNNALYYVNAVIDTLSNCIYTYSNNINPSAINYPKCQITKFPLPDAHSGNVTFEDKDIMESYAIEAASPNMQGGALDDKFLYIGRGYPGAGYVNMYIVDLLEKRIKYNIDLLNHGFYEEPEGAFFYNGLLYISTTFYKIYQFLFDSKSSSAKTIAIPFDIPE